MKVLRWGRGVSPPGTHGQSERQEAERLLTVQGAEEAPRRKTFSLDFGAMLGLGKRRGQQTGPMNSESPAQAREERCSMLRENSAPKLNKERESDAFPE